MRFKINLLEAHIAIGLLPIFLLIVSLSAYKQGDLNYLFYALSIYLFCFVLCYPASIILGFIPFIPREICTFYCSLFLLMFAGVPLILAVSMVALLFCFSLWYQRKKWSVFKLRIGWLAPALISVFCIVYIFLFFYTKENSRPHIAEEALNLTAPENKYSFIKLSYGNGKDLHRKAFSTDADWISPTFDASETLEGWRGFSGWYRSKFWGFNSSSLPLNARVWLPEGEGPFPVVFIVHGDHSMQDFSDDGYGYLAEPLAERRYIVAAIDNNFLNRSWSDLLMTSPLNNDIPTRAMLVVEHLKLWSKWNATPGSPLYKKIDMKGISLIGHSRGGEAVSIAPHFIKQQNLKQLNLKTIVAIAPVDYSFRVDGKPNEINGVNYLLLHGSMDGEIPFWGRGQYSRTDVSADEDLMKMALYIEGANHGLFNSSWGANDKEYSSPIVNRWNLDGIIDEQVQQGITRDVIASFLDFSVNELASAKEYLKDGAFRKKWHPLVNVKIQYETAGVAPLINFEDNQAVLIKTEGKVESSTRYMGGSAHAKHINWESCANGAPCSIDFVLPRDKKNIGELLRVDLSNATDDDIEIAIQVLFSDHLQKYDVQLGSQFRRSLTKNDAIFNIKTGEISFNTLSIKLDYPEENIESIKFIFQKTSSGEIQVDNIVVL